MKKFLIIICLVLPCLTFASDGKLHLSNNLQVNFGAPKSLVHSGSLLILNFDNWYFSHEVVDAKSYYQPVDLTDIEVDFFQSLFLSEKRDKLPEWLSILSSELSDSFGIKKDNTDIKRISKMTLLGAYSNEYSQGNIFIIDGDVIHHLNVKGLESDYKNIFNSIMGK